MTTGAGGGSLHSPEQSGPGSGRQRMSSTTANGDPAVAAAVWRQADIPDRGSVGTDARLARQISSRLRQRAIDGIAAPRARIGLAISAIADWQAAESAKRTARTPDISHWDGSEWQNKNTIA